MKTPAMIRPTARAALPLAIGVVLLAAQPARAVNSFCEGELEPMLKQRQELTQRLEYLGKHGKDPGSRDKFCGTLTSYMGNIKKIIDYMQTNKDFCGVPDDAISAARKGLAQNVTLRYKVCVLLPKQEQAARAAQAQAQAQGGEAPAQVLKPPVELKLE